MSAHRPIAFKDARLLNPANGLDVRGDLLVAEGKIAALGKGLFAKTAPPEDAQTIACDGHLLCPGLVDMQVATGEPGAEHKETLASASQAAAAGGVCAMLVMPDTNPVIDDIALVDFLRRRAEATACVRVLPAAAATRGLGGADLSEMALLRDAGAVAFTDADHAIGNALVMRRALAYARDLGVLVLHQPQDDKLAADGVMHEGAWATRLGLAGISWAAETIMVERDIRLAEETGARIHEMQISAAQSLDAIRAAKARGVRITCGVSVHHLLLNDTDIGDWRSFLKLSPPLRSEDDRVALVAGVAEGTIDTIVSAHNPQAPETKHVPFAQAASGAVGLEALLAGALSLYHKGDVPLARLLAAMSTTPARLLRHEGGRLETGAPADLTLCDLNRPWVFDRRKLRSLAKNTALDEYHMQGRVRMTLVGGRPVFAEDKQDVYAEDDPDA